MNQKIKAQDLTKFTVFFHNGRIYDTLGTSKTRKTGEKVTRPYTVVSCMDIETSKKTELVLANIRQVEIFTNGKQAV